MEAFPPLNLVRPLIELAKLEDLGPQDDDVTSRLTIAESAIGVATLLQKEVGIACGLPMVEEICRAYDERLRVELIPGFTWRSSRRGTATPGSRAAAHPWPDAIAAVGRAGDPEFPAADERCGDADAAVRPPHRPAPRRKSTTRENDPRLSRVRQIRRPRRRRLQPPHRSV